MKAAERVIRLTLLGLIIVAVVGSSAAFAQSRDVSLGIYGIWAWKDKDEAFRLISNNKFRIASGVGSRDLLDKANKYGVKCLIGIDAKLTKETANDELKWEEYLAKVGRQVKSLRDHPAVYGWYFLDEPSWHKIPVKNVKILYQHIKSIDNKHPVYTVFSTPDSWAEYLPYFDIVAVDPYLKSNRKGRDSRPEVVSSWLNKMRQDLSKIQGKKPKLWVVLGAFDERSRIPFYKSQFRKPAPEEFNKMVQLALDAKVEGIMVWTLAFKNSPRFYDWKLPSDDPELWDAVKNIHMMIENQK